MIRGKLGPHAFAVPILVTLLFLCIIWHVSVGPLAIAFTDIVAAFLRYDAAQFEHAVIIELRFPRALFALLVGGALSVAGALMQGITRNPLADPGLLGLLSGATFAVVAAVAFFPGLGPIWVPLIAAIGAILAVALVWGIALSISMATQPLILLLAGAAVSAFLGAASVAISLVDDQSYDVFRIWLTGSLAGRHMDILPFTLPWFALGLTVTLFIVSQMTALALGEEAARGLGINISRVRGFAIAAIVALTAAAVSIAGPLSLVGLVIPHVARIFFGQDYGRVLPAAAIIGAIYLLAIDTLARVLFAPTELSAGIMAALLGTPVFVWLVRTRL